MAINAYPNLMAMVLNQVIGFIKWRLLELPGNRTISEGSRAILLNEVTVVDNRLSRKMVRVMDIRREVYSEILEKTPETSRTAMHEKAIPESLKRLETEMAAQPGGWDEPDPRSPIRFTRTISLTEDLTLSHQDGAMVTSSFSPSVVTIEYAPGEANAGAYFFGETETAALSMPDLRMFVEKGQTPNGMEIIFINAESDWVFLLGSKYKPLGKENYKYRLEIAKGTEVTWPSLVDGNVVPNHRLDA